METHNSDPTTNGQKDPWDEASEDFSRLRERLRDTYRQVAGDHGPSEDEIKRAFTTLAGAWDQVAESLTIALKDPDTRENLKEAASSLATALGATITEFGVELRKTSVNGAGEDD